MSSLFLIRHGQAGLRHNYDRLSDLGRTQARLLGEHLVRQGVHFRALYAGALQRQQETAREVLSAFERAGVAAPELEIDPRWSEFDMDGVFRAIAPRLLADDAEFRAEHEKLLGSLADEGSAAHRNWSMADTLVVRAWMEARYEVPGESWAVFGERVRGSLETLSRFQSGEVVGVFSSATPIALWLGMALGLSELHMMRLAGVMYNSAVSTLRVREGDLAVYSFNGTAHLADAALRTFR